MRAWLSMKIPLGSRIKWIKVLLVAAALIIGADVVTRKCLAEVPETAPVPDAQLQKQDSPPIETREEKDQVGLLYIFNDSGFTLIPGKQNLSDNGKRLISLPRQTYAIIPLQPGKHVLQPAPTHYNQKVVIEVAPGQSYYVVIAYMPGRSWAAPFAGSPIIIKELNEEQAAPLLNKMRRLSDTP